MALPDGYTLRLSNADHDDHPDWTLVEAVCMQTDEVFVDPHQHHIGSLIESPDGVVVGAMWYSFEYQNAFSFHLAVTPTHRDIGLGSFMLDEAVRIFREHKQTNPALYADIFLVSPKVMQGLLNRGFYVQEISSLDEEYFGLSMQEAPPLPTFLQSAIKSDSLQFFKALHACIPDGCPAQEWPKTLNAWFKNPHPVDGKMQAAIGQFMLALPLPDMDLRYLWSQLQNQAQTKAPYPTDLFRSTGSEPEPVPTTTTEVQGFHIPHRP